MSGHPIAYEQLIAYAGDELEPAAAAAAATHVAGCPECAATVARYRLVRTTLLEDDSPTPPPATLARAKAIFAQQRRADPVDLLAPLRRVLARISFDSRGGFGDAFGPAFAGVRGAASGYQLAYESEAGEVDLQVEPPAGPGSTEWRVLGQVAVDEAVPGIRVALVPSGTEAAAVEAEADEYGVFGMDAPVGRYDLTIRLPTVALVVPDLEVG